MATGQGLALLLRLVSRYLTTQCTQVSEDTGISVRNVQYSTEYSVSEGALASVCLAVFSV